MSQDDDRDLSRFYRAGAMEEPPPSLDRLVKRAAHEIDRPSLWERLVGAGAGWRLGFSAFALAVLSVSLVTLMNDEAPLAPESGARPAAAPAAPDTAATSKSARTSPDSGATVASRDDVSERTLSPVQPYADRDGSAGRSAAADRSSESRRRAVAPEAASEKRETTDLSSVDRQAPSATTGRQQSEAIRDEGVAAPPPLPQAATAPAAPSMQTERSDSSMKPVPRAFEGSRRTAAAAVDEAPVERPEDWLARIEKILSEGKQGEAVSEMGRFRRRYPDHPVPAALKRIAELSKVPSSEGAGSERKP